MKKENGTDCFSLHVASVAKKYRTMIFLGQCVQKRVDKVKKGNAVTLPQTLTKIRDQVNMCQSHITATVYGVFVSMWLSVCFLCMYKSTT